MIVAAGLVILIAGCSIGLYRESLEKRKASLKTESQEASSILLRTYGGEMGALSLMLLRSDPSLVSRNEPFRDNVARVHLELPDGSSHEIFIPSEEEFESHQGALSQSQSSYVPLEAETGRVVPAYMEVTLYES